MRLKKPKFWDHKRISIWSILLFPFTIIFLFLVWLNKISSVLKVYKHPQPIICVGNIYVGGTGKTPLTAEIYKFLKSDGKKPSIIKKHYNYLLDEIKMLREIGDTFSSKNRIKALKLSPEMISIS